MNADDGTPPEAIAATLAGAGLILGGATGIARRARRAHRAI